LVWQPLGHHSHFEGWDGLCMVFFMRFNVTGSIHDLNRAIHYGQMAYNMLNPQHPRAFRYSNNLTGVFVSRYQARGDPTDLEHALFHARRALDLGPPDRRHKLLRDLATILTTAATHSGDIEMLSEAISLARESLECVHESQNFEALMVLGECLIAKTSYFGDIDDLKECIHRIQGSLKYVEEGTMDHTYGVINASKALLQQYHMSPFQHLHALTHAIRLLEAVGRHQIPEIYRAHMLHLTAEAYRAQFHHSGHSDTLKLAFAIDQEALSLRPPGHVHRCTTLSAISEDLVQLYVIGDHPDLGYTINLLEEALNNLAEGHPDNFEVSVSLAKLLLIPSTSYTNCKKGLTLILRVLKAFPGNLHRGVMDLIPVLRRVETNLELDWIEDDYTRRRCLDIYQVLTSLLPRLASLNMNLSHRLQVLYQACDFATKGYSHAIKLKQCDRAIEILESGRVVFWTQRLRLRKSFDLLDSGISQELSDISRRLEIIMTASSNISLNLDSNVTRARMERGMAERRRLATQFDKLVDEVQLQPGRSNFLGNLDFRALSSAAIHGPVVILHSSWLCVITTPHIDPHIIALPEVTNEWILTTVNTLRLATRTNCRLDHRGARKRPGGVAASKCSDEYDILADIWRRIIQPLLRGLGWKVS
jgi:hypothetical protein